MNRAAIMARELRVAYGSRVAVDGVDLVVPAGTVLGLLGHNGAGKTTLVRALSTLLPISGGWAMVCGHDVMREPHAARSQLALAGQQAALDDLLTARQNLQLIARLRHLDARPARVRAEELLAQFGLTDRADDPVGDFSGGMRRRLDLASCLITRPGVLFLDEPTTGLDPVSRYELWTAVRNLVADGVTVLLTTQYLEEADHLADTLVMLKDGRIIASGSARDLKRAHGQDTVIVDLAPGRDWDRALTRLRSRWPAVEVDTARMVVQISDPDPLAALADVTALLRTEAIDVASIALRPASLDEVFMRLNTPAAVAA